MANEEQLRILKEEGVDSWNRWREENLDVEIDLSGAKLNDANLNGAHLSGAKLNDANLSGAYLRDADLIYADLSGANLSGTDLRGADLIYADLIYADLRGADLRGTDLRGAKLRGADLRGAKLRGADLRGAKLRGADLRGRNLSGQDLSGQDLSEANLTGVNLTRFQAIGTNFSSATLTGACIEDWNINSKTNLENVICDYVYLKAGKEERRPSDSNRNFEPGEFAKLVEQSIETVDLIFKDGIDWKAFLTSFQDLRVEYGEQNVSIQAIEKKSNGAFVIHLTVPPDADDAKKAEIESRVNESYTKLAVLEAKNRLLLRENTNLNNIVYTLANRPIMNIDQSGSNIGIGHMSGGEIKDNVKVAGSMNIYASEQKQTLAEAAEEIQPDGNNRGLERD